MSANTHIQWASHTYNPWRGCRKVAPECANCYITSTPPFRMSGQKHGSVRARASLASLAEPLRWDLAAGRAGVRARVFCLSLGDWLDDENVPAEWLGDLLLTVVATPNLDWLLLTKRPEKFKARMRAVVRLSETGGGAVAQEWLDGDPPANAWVGVSAGADQSAALDIPAHVHFLSCEPMLHAMDELCAGYFDWIIFGGESGPKARPCDPRWIFDGIEFCRDRGISVFVKQLGSAPVGMKLRDRKGGDMAEWPEDLRVREFPEGGYLAK